VLAKALPPSCVPGHGSPAGSPPCETGPNVALSKVGGILLSKAKKNKYDAIERDAGLREGELPRGFGAA